MEDSRHGRVDAAGGLHGSRSFQKPTKSNKLSACESGHLDDTANTSSSNSSGDNATPAEPLPLYEQVVNLNEIPVWLAPCNLVAAIFQFMQAFILFAFCSLRVDLKWAIATNFPLPFYEPEIDEQGVFAVPGESQVVGYYSVTWLTAVFIVMSGISHATFALPRIRQRYEYYIQRHQSPHRWIEYFFSASLMRVLICQIAGVTDIHLIFSIFIMTGTTILFGLVHERVNAKSRADGGYPQDWSGFYVSLIPHFGVWMIIGCYYFTSISRGEPPAFVTTVVVSLFLLDFTFVATFILQWKKVGIYEDYLVGEFTFMLCSFTSKTFLAWITLAGAKAFE